MDKISIDKKNAIEYFMRYYANLNELIATMDDDSISRVISIFFEARINKKTIYFAGNGGSASTASARHR